MHHRQLTRHGRHGHPGRIVTIGVAAVAVFAGAVGLGVLPAAGAARSSVVDAASHHDDATDHLSRAGFQDDMRKLWEDHITWTRMYIVDAEAGAPETGATAQRLLQNQADIGNAVAAFYGPAAGAQLTSLLRYDILTAAALIAAAMSGDAAQVTTERAAWYANADQIADFLSAANPANWPDATMRAMMHEHLDLTLAEAVDHLQQHFTADIADYDLVHTHILGMADALASGIIAQFPAQFHH